MPYIFVLFAIFLFGCASQPIQQSQPSIHSVLEKQHCPAADDFKGTGIGESEFEALGKARAEIASNVQSRISAQVTYSGESVKINGEENLTTRFKQQIVHNFSLENASDAKEIYRERRGDTIGVAACLSRTNAAKQFLTKAAKFSDSLKIAEQTISTTDHPKRQNQIWKKSRELRGEFNATEQILVNLGEANSVKFAESKTVFQNSFDRIKNNYLSVCESRKLYWKQAENNVYADVAFSILSKDLRLERSQCEGGGIVLNFIGEAKCEYHFGINNCQITPFLSIENCAGAQYSKISAAGIEKGSSRADYAKDYLLNSFKEGNFWLNWERELQEWSPKCE